MTTNGLTQWIQDNVITLILLIIAAAALWAGKSGNISKVMTLVACGVVGLIFLALATTGAGTRLSQWLVDLVVPA